MTFMELHKSGIILKLNFHILFLIQVFEYFFVKLTKLKIYIFDLWKKFYK